MAMIFVPDRRNDLILYRKVGLFSCQDRTRKDNIMNRKSVFIEQFAFLKDGLDLMDLLSVFPKKC
jgi:hypothetical protein